MTIKPLSCRPHLKKLLSLCLLLATVSAGADVPFPGGVLAIQTDPQPGTGCDYDVAQAVYPVASIQYFFDGHDVWQIKTRGKIVDFKQLPAPTTWIGTQQLIYIAQENQDHEYKCIDLIDFNPKSTRSRHRALAMNRIKIGRLSAKNGIWYWAP